MSYPVNELLALIRTNRNAKEGWPRLLEFCNVHQPDETWGQFNDVEPERDVAAAAEWLSAQYAASKVNPIRGVYLGLDSLNQKRDPIELAKRGLRVEQMAPAKNVEISTCSKADPMNPSIDWAYERDGNWYGDSHLIESLVPMKDRYEKSNVRKFADYMLFLGYASLVLAEAIDRANPPSQFIAICGFHDGDLFRLCRHTDTQIERICEW